MTKLRITVTKEVLERAKFCGNGEDQGYNCAVALAVRDIFPNAYCYQSFMVFDANGKQKVESGFMDNLKCFKAFGSDFPGFVFKWIKKFDKSNPDERPNLPPISFEIDIPDEYIENINIDELKPLLENHPTLALV